VEVIDLSNGSTDYWENETLDMKDAEWKELQPVVEPNLVPYSSRHSTPEILGRVRSTSVLYKDRKAKSSRASSKSSKAADSLDAKFEKKGITPSKKLMENMLKALKGI